MQRETPLNDFLGQQQQPPTREYANLNDYFSAPQPISYPVGSQGFNPVGSQGSYPVGSQGFNPVLQGSNPMRSQAQGSYPVGSQGFNPGSNYRDLNTLALGMNSIADARSSTDKIWDPYVQMQLAKTQSPNTYGENIYDKFSNPNFSRASFPERSLFFQNYINPNDATTDYTRSLKNTAEVFVNVDPPKACHVFPPLLIRFDGKEDHYIPVEILHMAELKVTNKVPDIVLNFHADTKAINFTVCQIRPEKVTDLKIFVSVVYSLISMDKKETVDINLFTMMYDQARYSYLQRIGVLKKKSPP